MQREARAITMVATWAQSDEEASRTGETLERNQVSAEVIASSDSNMSGRTGEV